MKSSIMVKNVLINLDNCHCAVFEKNKIEIMYHEGQVTISLVPERLVDTDGLTVYVTEAELNKAAKILKEKFVDDDCVV